MHWNEGEGTRWTQIFAKRREKNLKKLSFSSYSRRFESRVLYSTSIFRERSLIASSLRASLFSALFNRCIRHFQSVYSPIGEFYDRVNGIMLTKYDLWVNFDFHSVKWIKKVLTGIKKNLKVYFTKRSSIVRELISVLKTFQISKTNNNCMWFVIEFCMSYNFKCHTCRLDYSRMVIKLGSQQNGKTDEWKGTSAFYCFFFPSESKKTPFCVWITAIHFAKQCGIWENLRTSLWFDTLCVHAYLIRGLPGVSTPCAHTRKTSKHMGFLCFLLSPYEPLGFLG